MFTHIDKSMYEANKEVPRKEESIPTFSIEKSVLVAVSTFKNIASGTPFIQSISPTTANIDEAMRIASLAVPPKAEDSYVPIEASVHASFNFGYRRNI